MEVFQRGRQPLNTAMAFDGDAKLGLVRFVASLQRTANLRQHLFSQLQQHLALRRKPQWLTFTDKQAETQALLQIAELMGEGRLGLMQRGSRSG